FPARPSVGVEPRTAPQPARVSTELAGGHGLRVAAGHGCRRLRAPRCVVIHAEGLVKRYGPVVAVDHLSFEVEPGETFAFVGPNGAGKTTTLRLLLGLARPDQGTITVGAKRLPPHDP